MILDSRVVEWKKKIYKIYSQKLLFLIFFLFRNLNIIVIILCRNDVTFFSIKIVSRKIRWVTKFSIEFHERRTYFKVIWWLTNRTIWYAEFSRRGKNLDGKNLFGRWKMSLRTQNKVFDNCKTEEFIILIQWYLKFYLKFRFKIEVNNAHSIFAWIGWIYSIQSNLSLKCIYFNSMQVWTGYTKWNIHLFRK